MLNEDLDQVDFGEIIKEYRIVNLDAFSSYLHDIFKVFYIYSGFS
jgi:hypothetical protein